MGVVDARNLMADLEQVAGQLIQPPLTQRVAGPRFSVRSPIDILEVAHQREIQSLNEVLTQLGQISSFLKSDYSRLQVVDSLPHERNHGRQILARFIQNIFVEAVHTIDFTLELRNRRRLVSSDNNEGVYFYLISVAGWNDALDRDNHDFGYHFHHVDIRGKPERTDVLLTFDPEEMLGPPDSLYWEYHGPYKHVDPLRWSERRRIAVHTAAKPSLLKPGKAQFKTPGNGATLLYSR